jgi:hypothetical protein
MSDNFLIKTGIGNARLFRFTYFKPVTIRDFSIKKIIKFGAAEIGPDCPLILVNNKYVKNPRKYHIKH